MVTKETKSKKTGSIGSPMSPQNYLDRVLDGRGYSIQRYSTRHTGYYARPTAFQQASYNAHLIGLLHAKDSQALKEILEVGLSPNPCSSSGKSLIHLTCRHSEVNMLKVQLEVGCNVQVSDSSGRTPLHEICRRPKPCFEMAEMIAKKDLYLFQLEDIHGFTPLLYVRKEYWPRWISFLKSNINKWWPSDGVSCGDNYFCRLAKSPPDSRPIPDPRHAVTIEMAVMVSSGSMPPTDVFLFMYDDSLLDRDSASDLSYIEEEEEDSDDDIAQLMNQLNIPMCGPNSVIRRSCTKYLLGHSSPTKLVQPSSPKPIHCSSSRRPARRSASINLGRSSFSGKLGRRSSSGYL